MNDHLILNIFFWLLFFLGLGVAIWIVVKGEHDGIGDLLEVGLITVAISAFSLSFIFFRSGFFYVATVSSFIFLFYFYRRDILTSTRPVYRNTLSSLITALVFLALSQANITW